MTRFKFGRLLATGQGHDIRVQLIRGAAGTGGLKVLSLPLTLLTTVILARGLGPEGFGQYSFVIAVITMLSIPFGPALMQLTTRETARLNQVGGDDQICGIRNWASRRAWVGAVLVSTAVGSIAIWKCGWRVDDRWALLLVGLIALPLLGLNAVSCGVLAGLRHVVMAQLPEIFVRPFVPLLIAAALLLLGILNPATAIGAYLVGAVFAFAAGNALLRRVMPVLESVQCVPNPATSALWTRAWMPFTLLVAASTMNAQVGTIFLGWLSTDDQIGAMQVADRGSALVSFSFMALNLVIGPHITRAHRLGNVSQLQSITRFSARMAFMIALPLGLPLIFFGGPILGFVFGREYSDLAPLPLAILVIGQLINIAFGPVGKVLVMSGYEFLALRGHLSALIINATLCLILIPHYKAIGAAVAVSMSIIVWNVTLYFYSTTRLKVSPAIF